jgi:hypothetical protein
MESGAVGRREGSQKKSANEAVGRSLGPGNAAAISNHFQPIGNLIKLPYMHVCNIQADKFNPRAHRSAICDADLSPAI